MNNKLWPLAFTAGFVDTSTFVGAEGMFSAHVTGNFVVFASTIFQGHGAESYLKLLTFPIFALGVIFVGTLKEKLEFRRFFLFISLFLLLGALSAGMNFTFIGAYLMVFAMGIQNAAHKVFIHSGPTSTVMTGNVTNLFLDMISLKNSACFQSMEAISFFLGGCLVGAFMTLKLGLVSVVLVAMIMGVSSLLQDKQ